MAKKIGVGTNSRMMTGHNMMTVIGQSEINAMIIDGTIGIMLQKRR